ncbi:MAG: toll/interleukin-1 receptor domain-containing protein [Rhizobiaceae bacterium]|nr:toll/interleukin-1 receptor domain-containing protein [Rhizobiaceae bacterium]MCZ8351208.1 toll/interleukin-1 receptor domain-containing protein [Rhizobium sp.]
MVEYLTRADLLANIGTISEQASVVRKAEAQSPLGATFLSHSSKDIDLLPGVIRILERHGAVVYVDKKDENLPPYTSRETAIGLRDRIKKSKKFVLLTTKNSKDSRWVPWELGLADGYKTPENAAILPSLDSATDKAWTEREYLGVYNRIVYGSLQGQSGPVYMVWNQDRNEATELSAWLRQ